MEEEFINEDENVSTRNTIITMVLLLQRKNTLNIFQLERVNFVSPPCQVISSMYIKKKSVLVLQQDD